MGDGATISWRETNTAGLHLVELSGVIDETFDGCTALARFSGRNETIVFDLDGVRRITSYGVRQWVNALRTLSGCSYYFIRCPPIVIAQFNMVHRFGVDGTVISFYLPYACPRCERDFEYLLDLRTERNAVVTTRAPEHICQECQKPTVFDDEASSYFTFVAEAPPVVVPTAVAALIDDGGGTVHVPLKVRKEVTDSLTAVWLAGTIHDQIRFKRITQGLEGTVVIVGQEVRGVANSGVSRLVDELGTLNADVYAARLNVETAAAVATLPKRGRELRIVSLWLPLRCDHCAELRETEVDASLMAGLAASAAPACASCGVGHRAASLSSDKWAVIRTLALITAPEEVAAYLSAHPAMIHDLETPKSAESTEATEPAPIGVHKGIDGYEVVRRIGVGGMAEVYFARQIGLEGFRKEVAIKRILPSFAADPMFVELFLKEARTAARISHANVVQIYDLRKSGDDFYMVMEYVPGWNLDAVLKAIAQGGPAMPPAVGCRMLADVCAGLHAAHTGTAEDGRQIAIIHRDISPHNILVSMTGAVKITDFGIAKATTTSPATKTHGMHGKLLYIAPERLKGGSADVRSDLFAAGLVLFQCLTKTHPFMRQNEFEVWNAALNAPIPAPSSLRPEIPAVLDTVLAKALARDPAERYQTAQELQLALESVLAQLGGPTTSADVVAFLDILFPRPSHAFAAGAGRAQQSGMTTLGVVRKKS